MKFTVQQVKERIAEVLGGENVIPAHNERGHFYKILAPDKYGNVGNIYPSVTGKLQIIKDESLINYKKNAVIRYVFANYQKFTDQNILEHLDKAEHVPEDVLADASDIGTEIHDTREAIFKEWIKTGSRPDDFFSFIKPGVIDIRLKSAIRALHDFCIKHEYVPAAVELYVYSHDLKVAGTLDDLGFCTRVVEKGSPECSHIMVGPRCIFCEYEEKREFVLMDLKSSNQFKDHYFFQVALYYWMFFKLTGLRPERCFILKVSKEDGTFKIEDLKRPAMLARYARSMLITHRGIEYIRNLRKDNQKVVAEKIDF